MLCSKYEKCVAWGLMWAVYALLRVTTASAQISAALPSVDAIRHALDQARFEDAAQLANALLADPSVRAQDRNDALEVLAIVQIAQRNSDRAGETLKLLFDRDPEHPPRVLDPGPAVDAAIARARGAVRSQVTVTMHARTRLDAYGRTVLDVDLSEGGDVVDTLHTFVRAERDAAYTEVVNHPLVDETATVLLPAAPFGTSKYKWYVEARAPSGVILARAGDASVPLESALHARSAKAIPTCTPPQRAEPLRKRWWVWTSLGIAVAGVAVGSALVAQ